jgi:hypothetical protein
MADKYDELAKEFWESLGADSGGAGIHNLANYIRERFSLEAVVARKDAALVKVYNEIIPTKLTLKLIGEKGVEQFNTRKLCENAAIELESLQELIRAALTEVE